MRKFYIALFVLISLTGTAQQANDWIAFNGSQPYSMQPYFKIKVWKNGIYRLDYNTLQAAGFFVNGNPKQFQIFHKGIEQAITVAGESDGVFDPADYIEFYGEKNDGWLDAQLYEDPNNHIDPYYSLFCDTAAYFLTINFFSGAPVKRMTVETDVNFSAYTPQNYIFKESLQILTSVFYRGKANEPYDPAFSEFEGFTDNGFSAARTITLNTDNVSTFAGAPVPAIDLKIITANNTGNYHSLTIDVNGTSIYNSPNNYGNVINTLSLNVPSNSILTTGTNVNFNASTTGTYPNILSIPFVKMRYAHALAYTGEANTLQLFYTNDPTKARLDINDFLNGNTSTRWIYVIDGGDISKITTAVNGNLLQALVPSNGAEKKCLLTTDDATFNSTSDFKIETVNPDADPNKFARFINYNYLQPNYDYLIVSHKKLWTAAETYRNYRALAHNPLLVDVDDLYNQFAYGIYKHPLAIKNFCKYAVANYANAAYLFLLGKAVTYDEVRANATADAICLVPTYGNPASDYMFSNKNISADTTYTPVLATGRLAAQNTNDVLNYLDKVMANEAAQLSAEDWMKQVLHFVGGDNPSEQGHINYYMDQNKAIIIDTCFGGTVTSYYKISTDPIQYIQALELQARIDSGVALMNFFGHAAGSTFDIATAPPQDWHNDGKYPVVIANSCNVGDIFTTSRLLNEDFVLLPKQGSVAFIAKPSQGTIDDLGPYSVYFYKNISYRDYAKGVGFMVKHAIDSMFKEYYITYNPYFKSTALGNGLHGDPAIKVFTDTLPDYAIYQPSVYFSPTDVTTDLPTFNMNIVISNLGKAVADSFYVHVERKFPNNDVVTIDTLLAYIPYKDTLTLTLPTDAYRSAGFNYFDVYVDYSGLINERSEINNRLLNVPLQIISSDISPVYPFKYAIVPDPSVILKATTDNIFAPEKIYKFEVDTNDSFSSPFLQSTLITQTGGVVKWPLQFTCDSGRVYYWRVSLDPATYPSSFKWKESSFIYIPGKTGWSQAHFHQFKNDKYSNVIYNKPQWLFEFDSTKAELKVNNWDIPGQGAYSNEVRLNGQLIATGGCSYNSIYVVVMDSISLESWNTETHQEFANMNPPYGSQCQAVLGPGQSQGFFAFSANQNAPSNFLNGLDSLASMINQIPTGNYVVLYSITDHHVSTWPAALTNALAANGIANADTIPSTKQFIFFFKKGSPSSAISVVAPTDTTREIFLDTYIGGNWYKGFITSEVVGPAIQWNECHWASHSLEAVTEDSIALDIIGIDTAGAEAVLYAGVQPTQADFPLSINHAIYPRLYMRAYMEDAVLRDPPQLDRWQIYYTEVPEAVVNPFGSEFYSADVSQGDTITWKMPIENVSNTDMTDLLVDFYLYDKNNVRKNIASPRFRPLPKGDTLNAIINFSSFNYPGLNSLWLEANPRNDQVEQYHFNNFAKISFNVNRDITNPILDVTFDGIHILNGDIVSAKPNIVIKLKDENKYLALNDTAKWNVYLKYPNDEERQLYFEPSQSTGTGSNLLKWTPAVLPDNSFRIEYNPVLSEDGIYELRAQARDESFNLSGSNDYRISFEVINKSTITNVMNYPNPFTTATRFAFTLTGSVVPSAMQIQILNISGKVVREITQAELGNIHIGRNITDYAWDGKDQYGDQLAKGVYLYRVKSQIDGSDIEHRNSGADKFFGKGWGKMYLLK